MYSKVKRVIEIDGSMAVIRGKIFLLKKKHFLILLMYTKNNNHFKRNIYSKIQLDILPIKKKTYPNLQHPNQETYNNKNFHHYTEVLLL